MKEEKLNYKITIITIVYNSAQTLEQCIISVLGQTYQNIEYVVIDGGSTDGSIDIIKKYEHKVSKWISEKDAGIADGFNKGIKLATGDLIGIINADDWFESDAVETIVGNLNNSQVYCGNINLVSEKGDIIVRKSKVSWLNYGMYVMHPSVFVKRTVYESVGLFDVNLKIAMDFDLFLRIKKKGYNICYIDKVIANMRTGGKSSDTVSMHKEELAVMKAHLSLGQYILSALFNYANRIIRKVLY